jgi:hypothetical protein
MKLRVTKRLRRTGTQARYLVRYQGKSAHGAVLPDVMRSIGLALVTSYFPIIDGLLTQMQSIEQATDTIVVQIETKEK